jgi:hypothetical protein
MLYFTQQLTNDYGGNQMSTAEATISPARQAVAQVLKSILRSSGNQIFFVRFIKKDKSIREMQARLHVKKEQVHGGKRASTTAHIPKYLTVYDVKLQAQRTREMTRLGNALTSFEFTSIERKELYSEFKQWKKNIPYRNINCETILDMTVKGIKHIISDENTIFLTGSENYTKASVIVGRRT